jgi:hypothetical protein
MTPTSEGKMNPIANVYFFVSRIKSRPAIKIGYSNSPKSRARAIECVIGVPVIVAAIENFSLQTEATSRERELHRRFQQDRIFGEWFEPTAELLQHIDTINRTVA